jgi:integrase
MYDIKLKLLRGQTIDFTLSKYKNQDLESFITKYFKFSKQTHSPDTYTKNIYRLKALRGYFQKKGVVQLIEIRPVIIQEYQVDYLEKHSNKSWNLLLGLVKSMLNKAVEWDIIESNPIAKLKLLKVNKDPHYFTLQEVQNLIEAAHPVLKSAIIILVNTGMRRKELYQLKWPDILFKERLLIVRSTKGATTKTRETRSVPISDMLYKHLKTLYETHTSEFVWKPRNYHKESLTKSFATLRQRLGLKRGNVHSLRHTFASYLAINGVTLRTIKDLLGHKNIQTTMIYAHLHPGVHKAAIEKLPF